MMRLSEVGSSVRPSATLALNARVKELRGQGRQVLSFAVGEPDFDTPEHIKAAAVKALAGGKTKYTPAGGTPELRAAICRKLSRENGIDYAPDEVMVSNGAKHCLYHLFQVLVGPGDQVIILAPYWVSYPEQVRFMGAEPVFVTPAPGAGFKVSPDQVEAAVTDKTRVLLLNSPSNPSGTVYSEEELRALCDVALRHDMVVISDEVYEKFIYGDSTHASPATFGREFRERVVTVNGMSKTYAMTGWRVGYAAGPKEIIKAASGIQSNATGCPNSIAQVAAVAALDGKQECVDVMLAEFAKRRLRMVERLNAMPGVACEPPEGAFYCFPTVADLYGKSIAETKVMDSVGLCELLLEKAGVGAVPGKPFGFDSCIRFSYATSMESIDAGMDAMVGLLKTVHG